MKQRINVEIGQKIREWTVICFDNENSRKGTYYICECKCGKRLSKPICELIRKGPNQCKSCATKARNFSKYGKPLKDLTGQKFGKWNVLERVHNEKNGGYWKCKCDCGSMGIIFGGELRSGRSSRCKSCGCKKGSFRHGKGTRGNIAPEYNSWSQMKQRCLNHNDKRYNCYGGRGITICQEWIDSFEKFLEYIGPRPGKGYSLDRINNDGNYEPGNIRWATSKEQANNRSKIKKNT